MSTSCISRDHLKNGPTQAESRSSAGTRPQQAVKELMKYSQSSLCNCVWLLLLPGLEKGTPCQTKLNKTQPIFQENTVKSALKVKNLLWIRRFKAQPEMNKCRHKLLQVFCLCFVWSHSIDFCHYPLLRQLWLAINVKTKKCVNLIILLIKSIIVYINTLHLGNGTYIGVSLGMRRAGMGLATFQFFQQPVLPPEPLPPDEVKLPHIQQHTKL